MCATRILAHTRDGYVARCTECNCLQMAFGTSVITFEKDELDCFRSDVLYCIRHCKRGMEDHFKSVRVSTPSAGIHVALTPSELRRLNNLLEEAYVLLMAEELIQGL